MIHRLPWLAAGLSGLLVWTAFPPVSQSDGAWFALVPLLIALRQAAPRTGFGLGWTAGFAFWLGNLAWLWRLTDNGGPLLLVVLGHVALAAYCALYTGLFGFTAAWLWRRAGGSGAPGLRAGLTVIAMPLLWVGTEHLRGSLLTGFAWNALGVSQYRNLALIQCAAWGGMSMVSALLVAVNGGLASFLERIWDDLVMRRTARSEVAAARPRRAHFALRTVELTLALVATVACWMGGIDRVRAVNRMSAAAPQWRLALFHPEAPSIFERDDGALEVVADDLLAHARLAGAARPDLCIWPETILPGVPPFDPVTQALVSNATAQTGTPLLAGGLEIEPGLGWQWEVGARYYNSAFLFDASGRILSVYRKQHLVPFGEYIPLATVVPWLTRLSPIGYSCTAGRAGTVLSVPSRDHPRQDPLRLGPLICFEDTLPYLARRAAQAGATLLVNLTNDGWFDGSSEAEQHLAQAVFRCVETGLPMVRSSNSGVTCAILPNGRVTRRIGQGDGQGSPGVLFEPVGVRPDPSATPFVRYGHLLFNDPCALLVMVVALLGLRRCRRGAPALHAPRSGSGTT